MKKYKNKLRGFSLITAIFLLVVLGSLGTMMVTFFAAQQQSSALDVMGSRAYQASRAGIEWGAFQIAQSSVAGGVFIAACTPGPTASNLPTLAGSTLSGFAISVSCFSTAHSDVSATSGSITVYELTSTATQNTVGTPDYIERVLNVKMRQ